MNPSTAEMCSKCGLALTMQGAMKRDDEMAEVQKKLAMIIDAMNDPAMQALQQRTGAKLDPDLIGRDVRPAKDDVDE